MRLKVVIWLWKDSSALWTMLAEVSSLLELRGKTTEFGRMESTSAATTNYKKKKTRYSEAWLPLNLLSNSQLRKCSCIPTSSRKETFWLKRTDTVSESAWNPTRIKSIMWRFSTKDIILFMKLFNWQEIIDIIKSNPNNNLFKICIIFILWSRKAISKLWWETNLIVIRIRNVWYHKQLIQSIC